MAMSKICNFSSISTSPVTETKTGHLEPNITAKVLSREVRIAQVSVGVGVLGIIVAGVCTLAVLFFWKKTTKNRNGTYYFARSISKISYNQHQKASTGNNRDAGSPMKADENDINDRTERETGLQKVNICLLSYQKCEYDESNSLHRAENVTEKHNGDDLGSVIEHNDKTFYESKNETT